MNSYRGLASLDARGVNQSKFRLRSSTALSLLLLTAGTVFLTNPQLAQAKDIVFSDVNEFQEKLVDIVTTGQGDSTLTYNGTSESEELYSLKIQTDIVAPGSNDSLLIDLQSDAVGISNGSLTIGKNVTMNVGKGQGPGDVYVGTEEGNGALTIDGGTLNISQAKGPNAIAVGYFSGGAAALNILNGGVINIGMDENPNSHGQFFLGYGASSVANMDNGTINIGSMGASIRVGMGTDSTLNMANGSKIDSSKAGSNFWLGERNTEKATANIDNSSIIIHGGGTNSGADTRSFVIGRNGGTGEFNQSGDDSLVQVSGLYRIGIGSQNDAHGVYNLNGGLLEVGREDIKDSFWIGVDVDKMSDENPVYQNASTAIFNVNGGTAKIFGNLEIANSGMEGYRPDSTVNINGGTVHIGQKVNFGPGKGKMNLNGGALELGGTDAITGSGELNFNGGTIRATSDLSINHDALISDGGAIFDSNGYQFTYSGILSGDGAAVKIGDGTLILDGANTYEGGTFVHAGTLQIGDANAIGTGPVTLDGGTLKLADGMSDFSAGIIAGAANGIFDMADQDIQLGGTNNGEGGITFENGNLTLNSALGWQGKTVLGSGVSLTTTGDNQLSEHSTLSFADATASLKSDTKQTIGGLEGNGNITIGDSLTVGVNNSDTVYGGQISSEGGLYKVGTGTLTLTNEQLYEGGTFVQDGVLALGENGKFWDESDFTLTGGVLDLGGKSQKASSLLLDGGAILNGKLETTGNLELKSGEFGIDLIGDSALEKSGDGTLVISGDNSGYSGVITVSAGEVQGTIAAFGTSNKIVNNGQVTFTDSGEANWDGAITGTGSLALTGGGDYTITGNDNTYSGQTLIQNASLTLNGELSNSDVIIENGGRFGGNNTVGSLTANGIIAPGNSIGVITTIGDFTLGKDGIYEVEVAANGENDRIIVGGKAYLEGGSIHVTALDDKVSYQQVQTHTFLTAEGGIEGEFSEAVTKSIFLRTQLDHQDDHVKLNVAVLPEDGYFENVATTSNQKAVARAVESLEQTGSALALYNSVLFSENENDARHAFTQLSGDSHASTKTALIDAINRAGDVVNNRIRAAFEGVASKDLPVFSYAGSGASKDTQAFDAVEGANSSVGYAAWATGFGSWLNHDSNANAGGLKASTGGFMSGVDMGFASGWRVGITGGYSQTDIKGKNRSASATSDNWHLGVYGGNQWGPLGLRAGLIHTWSSIDASRSVIYPGLNESLKADYDARTLQVFGEVGYRFDTTSAAFEPFVNLSHIRLHTDSFTETGGISRLSVESDNTNTTFTTLGLRAAAPVDLGSMTAQIKGTAGWRHAFNDVTPSSTQAFIDSNSFTVGGIPIAKDTALIEAGIDFAVSPTATLGLSYVGQYGSHAVQNGFNANLSVKF